MCYLCAWQATRMISDASVKWSVYSQKTIKTVFIRWTPTLELHLAMKTEENRHSGVGSRCLLGGCLLRVVHDKNTERRLPLSPREQVDFKKVGFLTSPYNESCFCHLRNSSSRQMQRTKQQDQFCCSSVLGRISSACEANWEIHMLSSSWVLPLESFLLKSTEPI